ncbi:toll/interleukin-1 receptor domain-containing protein [Synechococcus sp. PCC 7336]|uniref:toll/interleukin-1 receptor domain-containing protein n=1 Tax=Synechococcus sp. PCC 7336 TaxID=195250 RepID=UPI000344F939|nr:toll/interleukin-1 receptor domain-containing protein [Synechococcus sp. PCC 7336]
MSDIFISYTRNDRPKAERLARALEDRGLSVWWDRSIPAGQTFDDAIEEAIGFTRCVLVLWSKESVASRWVRTEAAEGVNRGILVPVLLEKVEMPLAFRRIQAADLSDWKGEADDMAFKRLVSNIQALLDNASQAQPHGVSNPPIKVRGGQRRTLLFLTIAAASVVILAIYLRLSWVTNTPPTPTSTRTVYISGNWTINDDEIFGSDEEETHDFEKEVRLQAGQEQTIRFAECVGNEVEGVLEIDILLNQDLSATGKGTIFYYEGTACPNDDLEDRSSFRISAPRDGTSSPFQGHIGDQDGYVRINRLELSVR